MYFKEEETLVQRGMCPKIHEESAVLFPPGKGTWKARICVKCSGDIPGIVRGEVDGGMKEAFE